MVGLLNLHTLPSRETFTLVKTLQVTGLVWGWPKRSGLSIVHHMQTHGHAFVGVCVSAMVPSPLSSHSINRPACSLLPCQIAVGSLALVVGLAAGGTCDTNTTAWVIGGMYEALRLPLVLLMVALHRRENIAKP